ncbi:TPA: IS21-like element ISCfr8 family transposase, partial [Enterobacter roggenkampii]|nr:helix-turn-helix domain-containing protein [Klebsiella pneumoniae]HDU5689798.1 helix-turn-helix domain-containing protein [Klebsiella pneumoniae]
MIHKIKSLHDDGKGLSIRAISRELGISRNSVRKYLRQDETTTARKLDNPVRSKQLDTYRGYLISLLASFPGLSAVKIARKLKEKLGELPTSERSIRRYVSALKEEVATGQHRYYEPVVDEVPGVQCQ